MAAVGSAALPPSVPAPADEPDASGRDGTWSWRRPEVVVSNDVARVEPKLLRETESAILQVGPINQGWLDWTVHLPDARVGCERGAPTYQTVTDGEPGTRVKLPGWCTLRGQATERYVVEWHVSLVDVDVPGVAGVRAGPMRGDGLF